MQERQGVSPRRTFSLVVLMVLILVAIGIWAKPRGFASKVTPANASVPMEASTAISPLDLMIRRDRQLPVSEHVDPF